MPEEWQCQRDHSPGERKQTHRERERVPIDAGNRHAALPPPLAQQPPLDTHRVRSPLHRLKTRHRIARLTPPSRMPGRPVIRLVLLVWFEFGHVSTG